jgi:hypothetical protein
MNWSGQRRALLITLLAVACCEGAALAGPLSTAGFECLVTSKSKPEIESGFCRTLKRQLETGLGLALKASTTGSDQSWIQVVASFPSKGSASAEVKLRWRREAMRLPNLQFDVLDRSLDADSAKAFASDVAETIVTKVKGGRGPSTARARGGS